MQQLKDTTESLRDAIRATGTHMLFRRAVQFETPSGGLREYAPGDALTLSDVDLASDSVCREVARLCAYSTTRGQHMARAQLFESADDAATTRAELLERQAEADERTAADAEASRGFATIVRGAATGRDADELAAENEMLRRELKTSQAAAESTAARLDAIEARLGGGAAQRELPGDSALSDEARAYCAAIQDRIDAEGMTQAKAIAAQRDITHDLPSNRVVTSELKAWRAEQAAAGGAS